MQKRARNLAAEELSIEVISGREWWFFGDTGLNISLTDGINIKSTFEVMMFGWGSAFPLPSTSKRNSSRSSREDWLNYLWFYSRSSCSNNRKSKNIAVNEIKIKNSPGQNKNLYFLEIKSALNGQHNEITAINKGAWMQLLTVWSIFNSVLK